MTRDPARLWLLAAAVFYAAAFAITFSISVPLNNELAAAGAVEDMADPAQVRSAYEDKWVTWNIVRTVFATACLGALAAGLLTWRRTATGDEVTSTRQRSR